MLPRALARALPLLLAAAAIGVWLRRWLLLSQAQPERPLLPEGVRAREDEPELVFGVAVASAEVGGFDPAPPDAEPADPEPAGVPTEEPEPAIAAAEPARADEPDLSVVAEDALLAGATAAPPRIVEPWWESPPGEGRRFARLRQEARDAAETTVAATSEERLRAAS